MFVLAVHRGTITSIPGTSLNISHPTLEELLKCWERFEVCDTCLFFLHLVNALDTNLLLLPLNIHAGNETTEPSVA